MKRNTFFKKDNNNNNYIQNQQLKVYQKEYLHNIKPGLLRK